MRKETISKKMVERGRQFSLLNNFSWASNDTCSCLGVWSIQRFVHKAFLFKNPLMKNSHDSLSRQAGPSSHCGRASADTHSHVVSPLAVTGEPPCLLDLCQHQWKDKHKWQTGCDYQCCQTSVPTESVHMFWFSKTRLADIAGCLGSQQPGYNGFSTILNATWRSSQGFLWC